jgi:glucokinase
MFLAGDIGGTKVNLGLFAHRERELRLARGEKYLSRRYARLEDLVREFLSAGAPEKSEAACFGIAGPVRNGRVQVTNLPWKVEADVLAGELKIERLALINDLEANGYGLAQLKPADFCVLNEGERGASGNAAIIAAGTGLGEAGLFWDGRCHHPFEEAMRTLDR